MDQLKIKMRQPHGKKLLQSLASDWQIYVLLLPVVTLVLALIVGLVILAVLSPIYDLASVVG